MLLAVHPLRRLVASLSLRVKLSGDDRAAILDLPHTHSTVAQGGLIVREGHIPDRCGVLVSGFAIRQKISGEGRRQILAVHLPGDAVDFQNLYLAESDHSVQMLMDGEVAFVARSAFRQLMRQNETIERAVMVQMLVETASLREWILNIGQRRAPERIAHLLCELGFRLEAIGLAEEYNYELPMTQEELGDATGITTVHVNRTLRLLEEKGMIRRRRRLVSFPDWQRMRELADFSTRYLHLDIHSEQ